MRIQIAENIKKYRIARGYTQSELAILLSVTPQAVSRWENGQAFPDITFLPMLAKYLNVSIDELMGLEAQKSKSLEKELDKRKRAIIEDEYEKIQNEQRILEIYEELAHTELLYLTNYFQYIMTMKRKENSISKQLENRIESVRQMIRDSLRISNMYDKMHLLSTVASFEDEEKLPLWADEYELPEYMNVNLWDELLLSRYIREKNINKLNIQNQKILYDHIKNTVFYLNDSVPNHIKERGQEFLSPERYKIALDTLSLYSTQVDDIFIYTRIIAEVRYAESLMLSGRVEKSLSMFSSAAEHLLMLYYLPNGSVLHGSVSVLSAVQIAIDSWDKLEKCVFNLNTYDKNPLFDQIREDKRFVAYRESLDKFLPQQKGGIWVNENGNDMVDARWEMLLNKASKEAEALSDGDVVVMLSSNGTVDSFSFQNLDSVIDAEGAMKFFLEKKKNGEARIERLICMWHNGSIDIPSFAFREALLSVDSANFSTEILLNGLTGYIVKTVRATMPKGYEA